MKNLIIVAILALLWGCKSKTLFQRMDSNKSEAVAWCNLNVPIVVKQGKQIVKTVRDTITDTVITQVPCPDGSVVDCPPNRTVYVRDTILQTDTLIDTRTQLVQAEKIKKLTANNYKLDYQISEAKKDKRNILILTGLLAGVVIFLIWWKR